MLLPLTASARTWLFTPLAPTCESALQVLAIVSNFATRLAGMAGVVPVPPTLAVAKQPPTKRLLPLTASAPTVQSTPLPFPCESALQVLAIVSNFATWLTAMAGVAPVPPTFAVAKEPPTKRLLPLTTRALTVLLTPLPSPCESALQVLAIVSNFATRLAVMEGVAPEPPTFAIVKPPPTKRLLPLTDGARTVVFTPLPLPCESALQVLAMVSNFQGWPA